MCQKLQKFPENLLLFGFTGGVFKISPINIELKCFVYVSQELRRGTTTAEGNYSNYAADHLILLEYMLKAEIYDGWRNYAAEGGNLWLLKARNQRWNFGAEG